MNDELQNEQTNLTGQNSPAQISICPICEKDPCVCSQKNSEENSDNKKPTGTKKPKVSWI